MIRLCKHARSVSNAACINTCRANAKSLSTRLHLYFCYKHCAQTGEQEQFALGQWLRKRYGPLLTDRYTKEAIFIQSTDVDRTLMSALSNLAGLFQPSDDQVWNPALRWQPIPVHTVPEDQDHVLAAKRLCPAYEYALKKYKQTAAFVALQKRFKPLYQYLTEKTGRKVHSFTDVLNLNNTLFIEQLYNRT